VSQPSTTQDKQVRRRRRIYLYIPYSAGLFPGIDVIGDKIKYVSPNSCRPQSRTTIKLVASSICSRIFEYLAGKCYVASDWPKNSEKKYFFHFFRNDNKKVENSEKKYFFHCFSTFYNLFLFTFFHCFFV
jgi:hypothetical protein